MNAKDAPSASPSAHTIAWAMSGKLNAKGYEYVQFIDPSACTACGLCFLSCPEPGALAVLTGGEDD